jgi:hypothetical protein
MNDSSRMMAFVRYIAHAALASYGIMILGEVVQHLLELPLGSQTRWVDYYFIGPTFLFPIVIGLILGVLWGASLPSTTSRLLAVVPLALLIWELWGWAHEPGITLQHIVSNFVGRDCSSSECLEEAWITSPVISALAYSVGAEIGRIGRRISRRQRYAPQ